MKTALNIKRIDPIRKGHHSYSIYHTCPYCGVDDWGSLMCGDESTIVACQCGEKYILEKDNKAVELDGAACGVCGGKGEIPSPDGYAICCECNPPRNSL